MKVKQRTRKASFNSNKNNYDEKYYKSGYETTFKKKISQSQKII